MTPAQEREVLAEAVSDTMRTVSALGERAQTLGLADAYYTLNGAWHKLDEAQRALAGIEKRRAR